MNYYNENDPKAAAWLTQLIAAGLIPPGVVDTRSISEIKAHEITDYTQHHFFAGIGGWSLALALAGVPASRRIVTGSCPCQPFSDAGKHHGEKDPRHLWPNFRELLAQLPPSITFGEQVASKAGREWLSGVRVDLETLGYEVGAADLCAASVGAPHRRQRLYWVAVANGGERDGIPNGEGCEPHGTPAGRIQGNRQFKRDCSTSRLAVADGRESSDGKLQRGGEQRLIPKDGGSGRLGNAKLAGLEGYPGDVHHGNQSGRIDSETPRSIAEAGAPWHRFDLLPCTDGKTRRVESGSFPLAHGVPGRVGLLRGYGNAIVPQVAAEFIQASLEAIQTNP